MAEKRSKITHLLAYVDSVFMWLQRTLKKWLRKVLGASEEKRNKE